MRHVRTLTGGPYLASYVSLDTPDIYFMVSYVPYPSSGGFSYRIYLRQVNQNGDKIEGFEMIELKNTFDDALMRINPGYVGSVMHKFIRVRSGMDYRTESVHHASKTFTNLESWSALFSVPANNHYPRVNTVDLADTYERNFGYDGDFGSKGFMTSALEMPGVVSAVLNSASQRISERRNMLVGMSMLNTAPPREFEQRCEPPQKAQKVGFGQPNYPIHRLTYSEIFNQAPTVVSAPPKTAPRSVDVRTDFKAELVVGASVTVTSQVRVSNSISGSVTTVSHSAASSSPTFDSDSSGELPYAGSSLWDDFESTGIL